LTNWPEGSYLAEWYNPTNASLAGYTRATATNRLLTLPLPDFNVDLAGILYPPSRLTALGRLPSGAFQFQLDSETGGRYWIDSSMSLTQWVPLCLVTNVTGTSILSDTGAVEVPVNSYRARQQQ
jgi:hypothetical protein